MKKFLTKITAFSLPFLLILSFLNVNYTNAASSSEPQIHLQNPDITESEYILQEPSDTKSYEEINIDELETIPPELLEDSDIDSINEPHEEIIDIPASKDEIQYANKNNNPPMEELFPEDLQQEKMLKQEELRFRSLNQITLRYT